MARSYGIGRRLEAVALLSLAGTLRHLPQRTRVLFGHALGEIAHAADGGHRRLARANIRVSLGVDEKEAARIARRTFRFFARSAISRIAQGRPKRWVARTAPVRSLIRGSISFGPELKVTGSTSQKTGL